MGQDNTRDILRKGSEGPLRVDKKFKDRLVAYASKK